MRSKTQYFTKVGILSAIALLLMLIETPLFFMPAFLKLDLSEIPALLGAFAMGPLAGVLVELIKNLLHLAKTQTVGIGELANFLVGAAYAAVAGAIYSRNKTRIGALWGLAIGTLVMTAVAAVLNYFVLIPLYQTALNFPIEAIIGMGRAANPMIVNLQSFVTFAIVPFNLIKGIVVSVVTLLVYKKVSPILH